MSAPTLFGVLTPRTPDGIDLRCCDVREMLASVRGARLVVADPPWQYAREAGVANPETHDIYDGMSEGDIADVLDLAHDSAADDARLACWATWPKLREWQAAGEAGPRWRYVTGGAWTKAAPTYEGGARMVQPGVGYHWRGQTEPVMVYAKGATGRCRTLLLNGHVSPPTDHSEKPIGWMREWIRAWTDPGDLVVDVFAGLAPLARACWSEGRRYVGAEIDPERHALAMQRLASFISANTRG